MPTADANKQFWDGPTNPESRGDEWSWPWGGPTAQWYSVILPRIRTFLPAMTILEIAPGSGRWTRFLIPQCDRLHLVNDERELSTIPDGSVDFAFSFESLVEADLDMLIGYAGALAQKLRPHGVAFLHHSTLGTHREALEIVELIPEPLRSDLIQPRWLTHTSTRARDVSAEDFAQVCRTAGLRCITQELVNWRENLVTDCFSTLTLAGSRWERENRVFENREFMCDAELIRKLAGTYTYERAGTPLPRQSATDPNPWD